MATDDKADKLKLLVRDGKARGYVLYNEIDELLRPEYEGGADLEDILSELATNNIEILETPNAYRDEGGEEGDEFLDEIGAKNLGEPHENLASLRTLCRVPDYAG